MAVSAPPGRFGSERFQALDLLGLRRSAIQLARLQDPALPLAADEVANVLDRRGDALVALDGADFLDGRICAMTLKPCAFKAGMYCGGLRLALSMMRTAPSTNAHY
jgi:hypothetical protein